MRAGFICRCGSDMSSDTRAKCPLRGVVSGRQVGAHGRAPRNMKPLRKWHRVGLCPYPNSCLNPRPAAFAIRCFLC